MTNTNFFSNYGLLENRIICFLKQLNIKVDTVYIHWVNSYCIEVLAINEENNKIFPYMLSITSNGKFYILEGEIY